jgi:hypothetical protein
MYWQEGKTATSVTSRILREVRLCLLSPPEEGGCSVPTRPPEAPEAMEDVNFFPDVFSSIELFLDDEYRICVVVACSSNELDCNLQLEDYGQHEARNQLFGFLLVSGLFHGVSAFG